MALPLKKRPYSGQMSVSNKRLRRMERQIYRNRPEMKSKTLSFNASVATGGTEVADDGLAIIDPCSIGQGTGTDDRIADKIRVYRIEIRGYTDLRLDWYLLQKKTTTNPSAALFTSQVGAYLLDSESSRFTEWQKFTPRVSTGQGNLGIFNHSYRFKGGTVVKFNGGGSTAAVDNEIVICVLNRAGSALPSNVTVRMWYTDA